MKKIVFINNTEACVRYNRDLNKYLKSENVPIWFPKNYKTSSNNKDRITSN